MNIDMDLCALKLLLEVLLHSDLLNLKYLRAIKPKTQRNDILKEIYMRNTVLLILVVLVILVFFLLKLKNNSTSGKSIDKEEMESVVLKQWYGWIQLKNMDNNNILIGKVISKHSDEIYFGYGYLINNNINATFLSDLQALHPLQDIKGNVIVKFGIDGRAQNLITELPASDDQRISLESYLNSNKAIDTVGVWMSSVELGLPKEKEEQNQFNSMWSASTPLDK